MGFALAVYATHQNWERMVNLTKEEAISTRQPVGLKAQLEENQLKRKQLEAQLAQLTEQQKSELAARTTKLAQLETEAKELRTEHEALGERACQAGAASARSCGRDGQHAANARLDAKEVDVLRGDIRKAQTERDDQFKNFVKVTDEYNQSQSELKRLKAQTMTLADQIAQYRAVANRLGINLDRRPDSVQPKLDGIVLASGA